MTLADKIRLCFKDHESFTLQDAYEKNGGDEVAAAMEAAKLRFRAVMMTNIAFILGLLPLVFASGAGAASRHSVGMTVFGGMIGL